MRISNFRGLRFGGAGASACQLGPTPRIPKSVNPGAAGPGCIDNAGYNVAVGGVKMLRRLLSGTSDAAIRFDDLCSLLESLGFEKRVKGSHHLFRMAGIEEKINLQRDGGQAKPYQVKQVVRWSLSTNWVNWND